MKSIIGIYRSHKLAASALRRLEESQFPLENVSLLGKTNVLEDHIRLVPTASFKNAPLLIGSVAGLLVGLLSGLGVFVIPGFAFLYKAGFDVGMMGGLELGALCGGLTSLTVTLLMDEDFRLRFKEHLNLRKYFLVLEGNFREVQRAKKILHFLG